MVEPIKPTLRTELLKEHGNLDESLIDRLEELTAERFNVNPETEPERLKEIDAERRRILREHMPRYDAVCERLRTGLTM